VNFRVSLLSSPSSFSIQCWWFQGIKTSENLWNARNIMMMQLEVLKKSLIEFIGEFVIILRRNKSV
jgi:hypothetical protein